MSENTMDEFEREYASKRITKKKEDNLPIPSQNKSPFQVKDEDKSLSPIISLLNKMVSLLSNIANSVQKTSTTSRDYWFDESDSITIANNTAINDPDSNAYTRIRVFEILGRTSPRLTVYNDGPGTLFVRASHGRNTWSITEFPIYEGEAKSYVDVYELRMRATVANLNYRVTEFELWKQKNVDFRAGRGYVRTQAIAVIGATPAAAYLVADEHDFNATLTRNASTGYIKNTSALTDLWVWFSQDGTEYGQSGAGVAVEYTTVDPNGAINIDYMDVHSIKLGASVAITYQIVVA